MFGEPVEAYSYGDLRIARTCGLGGGPVKKLIISISQIGGKDPAEKDMLKVAQMLGIDMKKDVKRYTTTSYGPYLRHTFYFEQIVDGEVA